MGGTCSTDGKQWKCMQVFGRGNHKNDKTFMAQEQTEDNIKVEIKGRGQQIGPVVNFYKSEQKKLVGCCEHKINPIFS